MRSVIYTLLIAALVYQSLGLMLLQDVSLGDAHIRLRDQFSSGRVASPFVTLRIPNKSSAFNRLGLMVHNKNTVLLNGVPYQVLSTRIFTGFLELRIQVDSAMRIAWLLEKGEAGETSKSRLTGKQVFPVLLMLPPVTRVVEPGGEDQVTRSLTFAYCADPMNGFCNITGPPPKI